MKHDANCARLKSTKACDCGLWGEAEIKAYNARLMTTPSAPMTGERMKEIEARHERYTAWIAQRGAGHLEREMHQDRAELLAELKRRDEAEAALRAQLDDLRRTAEKLAGALNDIEKEYRAHDKAGIDVMAQYAIDALTDWNAYRTGGALESLRDDKAGEK